MTRNFFLADADNVSVDVIAEALTMKLASLGALHVRRCYCTAEFAKTQQAFLKKHSLRAMVNTTAGKNCTDIALAVDATQMAALDRPAVVVIVASDSDFAPLVMHLRDLGCRVEGVGQHRKTGAETHLVYDDFVDVGGPEKRQARAPRPAPRTAPSSAPSSAPRAAAAVPAPPAAAEVATPTSAPRSRRRRSSKKSPSTASR